MAWEVFIGGLDIIGQHLRLSLGLFWRHGLLLTAIWAAGMLAGQVLLMLAVAAGLQSRLLGLFAIAPVILVQLLVFVAIFTILRQRAAPVALAAAPSSSDAPATPSAFAGLLLVALIPFYAYYAGWGLLSDTLRDYSKLFMEAQLRRIDFADPQPAATALEVGQALWVVLAVLLVWVLRRVAKAAQKHSPAGFWPFLVVACEATWALLGLYVIAGWKNGLAEWLAHLPPPGAVLDWLVPAASAAIADAGARPVDWAPVFGLRPFLAGLFWYALLPLVWFNLGGIVQGHDLHAVAEQTRRASLGALDRWWALPKPLRDFVGHFWAGMAKRWNAVVNGVLLAASAGMSLTVSVLVLWRLVDWLGNWAWIGAANLIGPQAPQVWQIASVPLGLLFGAPGGVPGGLLVSPLQFCILAAGLELAARARSSRVAGAGAA